MHARTLINCGYDLDMATLGWKNDKFTEDSAIMPSLNGIGLRPSTYGEFPSAQEVLESFLDASGQGFRTISA